MTDRTRIEEREVEFFDSHYKGQAYNATGWRLRLDRELGLVLRQAGAQRLGRVLSIGCGDGQFEVLLAAHAEHVTGLDISPEAVALAQATAARAGATNVTFLCQPLSELAWDDAYDAVLCIAFLHHVPEADMPALLSQSRAHLVPGGFFYSSDPNVRGVLRAIGRVVMGAGYDRYHSPDEREIDPADLAAQLRAAGFPEPRIGWSDLTLTPLTYILAKGPGWPLHACAALDWLWCRSPLARWSSAFTAFARRPLLDA